ncbi:gliding motility protein GldL [uncultured Bacteroides sp.]|uniref:type IX secretion system motor protein PorL/GldL n=1 Tax=uncultured Bacteroides sp. TaxID=162156 RepID=UPI002AAC2CD3|nr:gliding motility protein GldL [uncultured Bacteroides sp.]
MGIDNKRRGLFRRLEDFLASYKGKVVLNYAYSWGASIVITGVLFKLTHLPGANLMLWIGMGTEVLVFFISAFDRPYKSYKWESVFPNIKISGTTHSKQKEWPDDDNGDEENNLPGVVEQAISQPAAAQKVVNVGTSQPLPSQGVASFVQGTAQPASAGVQGASVIGGGNVVFVGGAPMPNGEDWASGISGEVAANSPEVADATAVYLTKLESMADTLERFNSATNALAEVSDTLLRSYKSISDNSDSITTNSQGYVDQMQSLNRNLMGLNTIYEIQLKSISSQIDTIDKVNIGLTHIKEMYEGSTGNSEKFNAEAEKMAQQIEELNKVYARMLKAMTVNMNNQQQL